MFTTPAGKPSVSASSSANMPFTSAVWPAIFTTLVQPAASAGASGRTARTTGEFQGTMMPATDGLAQRLPVQAGGDLGAAPGVGERERGRVAQLRDRQVDLQARLGQGLAGPLPPPAAEPTAPALEQVGHLQEDATAQLPVARPRRRPEGAPRRL